MKHIPLLFALLIGTAVHAQDQAAVPVKIEGAWVRAVPPGSSATAAYMRITNTGQVPLKITGAASPVASQVKPMITTEKVVDGQSVRGMEIVEFLEIPAGGTRVLEPGGDHIMLMKMKEQPAEGSTTRLEMNVEPGNHTISVELPVSRTAPK